MDEAQTLISLDDIISHRQVDSYGQGYWNRVFEFALKTLMRDGEILGLRWNDVSLETGAITIRGTAGRVKGQQYIKNKPKSETSKRELPNDPNGSVVKILREQLDYLIDNSHPDIDPAERLMLLSKKEFSDDLIFPNTKGSQMDASQPVKALKRAFQKVQSTIDPADYKRTQRWQHLADKMSFHDLRVTGGGLSCIKTAYR